MTKIQPEEVIRLAREIGEIQPEPDAARGAVERARLAVEAPRHRAAAPWAKALRTAVPAGAVAACALLGLCLLTGDGRPAPSAPPGLGKGEPAALQAGPTTTLASRGADHRRAHEVSWGSEQKGQDQAGALRAELASRQFARGEEALGLTALHVGGRAEGGVRDTNEGAAMGWGILPRMVSSVDPQGERQFPPSRELPAVEEESNVAGAFAGLEWVSRDAAYQVSSVYTNRDGSVTRPLPGLLTEEGLNSRAGGKATVASFHTDEEENPHIIITLKGPSAIAGVFIENVRVDRTKPDGDEMFRRGARLAVWVSEDGNSWQAAWRAHKAQASWFIRFKTPVTARYVKVGLLGRDYLHLAAVRIYGSPTGLPALTRLAGADRVALKDGRTMLGAIENKEYAMTAAFGKTKIPASRVVGIVPDPDEPARVRLVQADGQVIAGTLAAQDVQFTLTMGSTLTVPLSDISEVTYRVSAGRPASFPSGEALVVLRSGDRLIWTSTEPRLQLSTPYGRIDLPSQSVRGLKPADPEAQSYRADFRGGSSLTGTLLPKRFTLNPRTFPALEIDMKDVRQFTWPADSAPLAAAATLRMRNGDRLVGSILDETLTLRTEYGGVKAYPGSLRSMEFDANQPGRVRAKAWDGTDLAGELGETSLTVALGPEGPRVTVKTALVASLSQSCPLPPPETQRKVEALVSQLSAESYKDRQAAEGALAAMGKAIVPLLAPYGKTGDPEVRQRIEAILEQMNGEE